MQIPSLFMIRHLKNLDAIPIRNLLNFHSLNLSANHRRLFLHLSVESDRVEPDSAHQELLFLWANSTRIDSILLDSDTG